MFVLVSIPTQKIVGTLFGKRLNFTFRLCYCLSKNMSEIVQIDGSVLEGGGQILRMSIALSALLRKPIKVINIRAGRSTPGLRPQHLAGLMLVSDICNGQLTGGTIGSTEITFHPRKIRPGSFRADPKTAGSIMLLFQVAFPCLLFASEESDLHLKGGTNAEMAPQIDHTIMVFKPIAELFGAKFDCKIAKRGYFPKGGGDANIQIYPVDEYLKPITLMEPGTVASISGYSFVAGVLPIKLTRSMVHYASRIFKGDEHFRDIPVQIREVKETPEDAIGNGSGIVLAAKTSTGCFFGGSALGRRDLRADCVGTKAAKQLVDDVLSGGCVDRFTQDQLIILMVLAKGKSRVLCGTSLTMHTQTAIYIAEKLTEVKFSTETDETSGHTIIECEGIGFKR